MECDTVDKLLIERRRSRFDMRGSGAAQATPHTLLGGYLTSESSSTATVVGHHLTVKAGCAADFWTTLAVVLPLALFIVRVRLWREARRPKTSIGGV
jgi:hypothetical protein